MSREGELIARLRAGREVRLCAVGGSMWPTIRDGAVLRIEPCPAARLRSGDLGAFVGPDGRLVVHRLVRTLTGGHLEFRGDGLDAPDAPVAPGDVLGVARIE